MRTFTSGTGVPSSTRTPSSMEGWSKVYPSRIVEMASLMAPKASVGAATRPRARLVG